MSPFSRGADKQFGNIKGSNKRLPNDTLVKMKQATIKKTPAVTRKLAERSYKQAIDKRSKLDDWKKT